MKNSKIVLFVIGIMLVFSSLANAAPLTDVIQNPSPYFVDPVNWQTQYRWYNQDWGWNHHAIAGTITTASLNIAAYDVDWSQDYGGEHDLIYAYKGGVKTLLGELAGASDQWAFTTFNLDSTWFTDIASGLKVFMDIDSTHTYEYWAVALSKSALSVDNGTLPNPEPTPTVPEPSTVALLGLGLAGIAFTRKRMKK